MTTANSLQSLTGPPPAMDTDWLSVRARYRGASQCVYLNTASRGLLSSSVRDAGMQYYQQLHDEPGAGLGNTWSDALERARGQVAQFIGAEPQNIAFVANASSGINLAADLLADRGEVLAHSEEFPSVTLPWQQRGHALKLLTPDAHGVVSVDAYRDAIRKCTRHIALSAVQYSSGYRVDLTALRALCDQHNLSLVVDATQAVGAIPIDVREFRPDIMVFSSYKWLCSGYGVAALYVAPHVLAHRALPCVGWRSAIDAYGLRNHDAIIARDAYALELGNPVMPAPLALGQSISELNTVGIDTISRRLAVLTERLHAGARALGIRLRSPSDAERRGPICMLEVPDPEACAARLLSAGIHTSARNALVRVSPHLYNNEDDIDALLEVLATTRSGQ